MDRIMTTKILPLGNFILKYKSLSLSLSLSPSREAERRGGFGLNAGRHRQLECQS